MIKDLKDLNELNKIKNLERSVVWFSNPMCAPCKKLEPILIDLSIKYGKDVNFYRVNVEKNPEIAIKYNITSIPTIIFFKKGKEFLRLAGFIRKDDIVNSIKKFL